MRLLGFEITRRTRADQKALQSVGSTNGGWVPLIREPYSGAWQRNDEKRSDTELVYFAVFSCMTLIASDVSKMAVLLTEKTDEITRATNDERYSPVLRKPNRYQTRIQFWETWMLSKLGNGNAYILKQRDVRGTVVALHVLDPWRVRPMVSDSGDVFYQLASDDLAQLPDQLTVPASEIIHDRFNCLFHPLVGLSPLIAGAISAQQGREIQEDNKWFFKNRGLPGGVLTAPGAIGDETAARLKKYWDDEFSGQKAGHVAVVGDGLKFEAMRVSAVDSQMIEQLKWTAEVICSVFHVPPYKIGIGPMPTYNNIQALNLEYYQQALQTLIEAAELVLDEGLELPDDLGVMFDIRQLLRMDSSSQMERIERGVSAGVMSPNEGRREINLPPVKGGDTPYLQQQNYSLAALDERDQQNPLSVPPPSSTPAANDPAADDEESEGEAVRDYVDLITRELAHVTPR